MTTVRYDLDEHIEEVENEFITLSDGCRLAARIFLPKDGRPAPAILEYLPYRKRDFMRERDERMHRYFAGHGYVALRVDIRGSGDSDGTLSDEYTVQEQRDAVEVIAWIAAQPWCSGAVGMMGISWGGFNALQVAALRPPQLKAIITLCASDDRYTDDAHYMGGCLLNENLQWGSILMLYNALPPDPELVPDWREAWLARLDAAVAFPALWMRHPHRDDYWKQGSVNEDFAAIECPVYAIGGWADGYSNAVPRLLEGLSSPKKGLIGPWAHSFPHSGIPGPRIGFLQEALRWWEHWLKGEKTSIMDEPQYRVWMQESVPPQPQYDERPGRWVSEPNWPPADSEQYFLHLAPGVLQQTPPEDHEVLAVTSPQITGMVSGEWCAFGSAGEMPLDQRPDDGRSLVFDGDALTEDFEIVGAPVLEIDLAVDAPVALLAVRLNDVAPDGASTRVSYGLLNLCHRHGSETPQALKPGCVERIRVQLNDIAHQFKVGHRVRLALSTSYWPIAWPSPTPVMMQVHTGQSRLYLPHRPNREGDTELPDFLPPESGSSTISTPLRPLPFLRRVERDLTTGEVVYTLQSTEFDGHVTGHLPDIDLELGHQVLKRHIIRPNDPLSAKSELKQWAMLRRGKWSVRVELSTKLSAEQDNFHFVAEMVALEDGIEVRRRTWDERLPRKLV